MSIELMSPAGSFESLMAAIKAGCNSIYFGVEQLNMRARSSVNFTLDDLKEIAKIGKENGIKSYLTINTVLYDHDIQLMKKIIDTAAASGITAVIASDHAVLNYLKKTGMPAHISTQANISNIDAVEFYSFFADVMVLARELSLQQTAQICREIQRRKITGPSGELVRVEIFCHGALCMAVSGKCYLSLHSHNASANRGACIQNCRRSYIVTDKEEGVELEIDNEYIMSAKDLNTIGFLDKIADTGVGVIKIEGRGRSADYVYTVTQCYREALESLQEGTYTREKIDQWNNRLETVFNRGFWDGYYMGQTMGEWNDEYGSKSSRKKIYIGKARKYFPKIGVGEFIVESHSLNQGDRYIITGSKTGFIEGFVTEIRVEDNPIHVVIQQQVFSMLVSETIRPGDKLYKWVDA